MLGLILVKGVCSLGIIGGSYGIGVVKGKELDDKVKDTQELQRILVMFENEISYRQNSLPRAINSIANKTDNKKFKRLFNDIVDMVINEKIPPYEALQQILGGCVDYSIDNKIIIELQELLKNMGNNDIEGELKNIEAIQKNLEQLEKEYRDYRDKYKKIYNMGGGLIGTTISLLLI